MISVVCVYDNERTLKNVLLKSLAKQTVEYELITLDNTRNRFISAAEALNYGGAGAKGDYIMFAHQDMWLGSDSWLEGVEQTLKSILDLGVAGVVGMSENGGTWGERVRYSIEFFNEACLAGVDPVEEPEEVQTLDECLLIVPRPVFSKLQFDEKVFYGWDCYGADYCLSVKQLGLKAYVIPAPCSHSCLRAIYRPWEFKELLRFHKRLYKKHSKNFKTIYTTFGEVSRLKLCVRELVPFLAPLYFRLLPSFDIVLERELSGCETVLDLCCGDHSMIQLLNIPLTVGVELFEPYLEESKRKGIHSQYIKADISKLEFKPKSFDAVIAIEVLEHLEKQEGYELLGKAAKWARKKVIITTPNGYLWPGTHDYDPREHKCGWNVKELRTLGFKVHGIYGWKRLGGYTLSKKYKPAFLGRRISELTQKMTYYFPGLAFELFAVRQIHHSD